MFSHFLVPLDGSTLAEAILPVAGALAECLGARVTFLHVVEPAPPATIHGQAHLMNAADADAYLSHKAQALNDDGIRSDWHVDVAAGGDVPKAIFAHGEELKSDLILLTDHGRSGLKSVLLGSIAQQVLQSGKIPVLLVKVSPDVEPQAFECRTIAVALDGSALYGNALTPAAEIGRACGAELDLIIVVPTPDTLSAERSTVGTILPTSTRAILDLAQAGALDYMQTKIAELAAQGIQARGQVVRGLVPPGIINAAEQAHADLLVMATHGRAGLAAFWSGSIAPKVVSQVRVPVLLLRVEGEEPERLGD